MTAAQDKVKQMQGIARGMLGHSFYSNVISREGVCPFLSQAKRTLSHYQGGCSKDRKHLLLQCFGCSGPHPWMKDKKLLCPNGKDPACIKHAAEQYKKFCAWLTELCSKRSSDWHWQVINFKDMDEF
jgi:hypothetical protein